MPKGYSDLQLRYVAHGVANDLDPAHVCESAGLTKHMYEKLLGRENVDPHQLSVYDAALSQASARHALVTMRHVGEIERMVPTAYRAIDHVAGDYQNNPQLAFQAAKYILNNSGAPTVNEAATQQAAVNTVNTQINMYAAEKVAPLIDDLHASIVKTTEELMTVPLPAVGAPSRHVYISSAETIVEPSADDTDPLDEAGG